MRLLSEIRNYLGNYHVKSGMYHYYRAEYTQAVDFLRKALKDEASLEQAEAFAEEWIEQSDDKQLQACLQQAPQLRPQIKAMLLLAQMDEVTLNPIFGLTDALGSVMRKKLKPLTDPLLRHIDALLN